MDFKDRKLWLWDWQISLSSWKRYSTYIHTYILIITGVQASGVITDRLLRQCCFVWSEIVGPRSSGNFNDWPLKLKAGSKMALFKWLTLNLSKTKYLVFQPRQKVNSNFHPPLKIADQYLEQSYNIKYLGLVIDCFLSWHDHIDHISSKISKSVNIIAKLKRHVTTQSLISIYYALVYPYLNYGCILWGNNYEAPVSQLVKLQNKVVRVINNVPLRDHITPHYANLGLIKLPDIVKLNTCQLIYDHFVDKKPSNFTLASVSEQHNYDTRSASLQHLNPSSFRINLRKFCPTVIGCYYWNDIPLSIREKTTKKLFKRALFNYYLAQY